MFKRGLYLPKKYCKNIEKNSTFGSCAFLSVVMKEFKMKKKNPTTSAAPAFILYSYAIVYLACKQTYFLFCSSSAFFLFSIASIIVDIVYIEQDICRKQLKQF